jgi:hypothetical protein
MIMKKTLLIMSIILASASVLHAQEAGASVYNKSARKTSGVVTGTLITLDGFVA